MQSTAAPSDSGDQTAAIKAFEALCRDQLHAAQQQLSQLENPAPAAQSRPVLEELDSLLALLDRATNLAGLYRAVHPDARLRHIADLYEQEFAKVGTAITLSRPIYEAVAQVDSSRADATTKRFHSRLLRDFKRAGVTQDVAIREQIKELRDELVKMGQAFDTNIREDVRELVVHSAADLAGLPPDYIAAHPPRADGTITLTTNYPDYVPFMTYAKADHLRLEFYRIFRQRGFPKNVTVLQELLNKRYRLARLLGYRNWAHYVTEDKMIKSDVAAQTFIDRVADLSKERAARDYEELLAVLRRDVPQATAVGDWQKAFMEEVVKREKYSFDAQAARQYFPYARVQQGVLDITSRMFGLTYRRATDTPVWHPSVEAYEVWSDDKLIGRFYLDMHPRADKYKHAAAFPIRSGQHGKQIPEAALICNFPGGDGTEGLMEHDEVQTFFHEFGHLLHHLFGGDQRWIYMSGIATEWDFVEAPSQMLEEWAFEPEALKTFAINAAGETIPDALIAAMRKARDFGVGLWVRHQMFYAAVSLHYYNRDPQAIDTTAMLRTLQGQYSPFAYVDDTYFQYSFGHLDGYSAIYYTYMWSLVIAKDLFSVFTQEGLLNPKTAQRYRRAVLEPGGSRDAADLVHQFLGRDFSFDAFAAWLDNQRHDER